MASLAIDANRFKPEIETAAASAGIELAIEGNIDWQLLPPGIALNQVSFTLNDKSMAGNADQLAIGINFKTLASLKNHLKLGQKSFQKLYRLMPLDQPS